MGARKGGGKRSKKHLMIYGQNNTTLNQNNRFTMKLKSIFLMLSSLLFPACQHQEHLQPSSPNLAVWGDDMTYMFLDEDNKDGKRALKIAKKYGDYKNYYPRYRIGNLAILDASTPPPKNVMDANSKTGTVGVIFGDEPRYVTFPDQELL